MTQGRAAKFGRRCQNRQINQGDLQHFKESPAGVFRRCVCLGQNAGKPRRKIVDLRQKEDQVQPAEHGQGHHRRLPGNQPQLVERIIDHAFCDPILLFLQVLGTIKQTIKPAGKKEFEKKPARRKEIRQNFWQAEPCQPALQAAGHLLKSGVSRYKRGKSPSQHRQGADGSQQPPPDSPAFGFGQGFPYAVKKRLEQPVEIGKRNAKPAPQQIQRQQRSHRQGHRSPAAHQCPLGSRQVGEQEREKRKFLVSKQAAANGLAQKDRRPEPAFPRACNSAEPG